MEELFSNNIFAVFIIACLAVISYTNFKENQRIILLYLFTYGTTYFGIFSVRMSIILFIIITFVFLEYLTADGKKLELFIKFSHKCLDYFFMMFFQYHFLWIIFAFIFLVLSRSNFVANSLFSFFNGIISSSLVALGENGIAASQISCSYEIVLSIVQTSIKISSIFLLCRGIHLTISQSFKIMSTE